MADKKIFTIEINGIKESTTAVDTLLSKLNELQGRIKELSKGGVKIKIGGDGKGESSVKKEVEETTNTLAGMRKQLAALKKELANTELGTEEWTQLRDRVLSANTAVKEIEQSYGVFSRNVGNYTNSFLAAFNKFPKSVQTSISGLKSFNKDASTLGQQLNTVNKSMEELQANGQENTETYKALKQVFDELSNAQASYSANIESTSENASGLKSVIGLFETVTGSMEIAAGAASFFGSSGEQAVKAIEKLQGLQAISGGLKNLQEALQKGGVLWKAWQKSLSAADKIIRVMPTSLRGTAAGMTATATATRGATVAMNGLKVAIASTGIGLLVIALGALVSKLMDMSNASEKAREKLEAMGNYIDSSLERSLDSISRKRELGLISALEEAEQKLARSRVNIDEELKLLELSIESARNKFLSFFGNEFEGDDELIRQIQELNEKLKTLGTDLPSIEKAIELIDKQIKALEISGDEAAKKQIDNLKRVREAYQRAADGIVELKKAQDEETDSNEEAVRKAQEYADKRYKIEQQLAKNELALHANTLRTRLASLRLERDAEIREAQKSGIMVGEQRRSIIKQYQQMEREETIKWLNETADEYNAIVLEKMKSDNTFAQSVIEKYSSQVSSNDNRSLAKNGIFNTAQLEMVGYNPEEEFPELIEGEKKYWSYIQTMRNNAYNLLKAEQRKYYDKLLETQKYEETESYNRQRSELQLELDNLLEHNSNEIDIIERKQEEIELLEQTHNNKMKALLEKHNVDIENLEREINDRRLYTNREGQNRILESTSIWLGQLQELLNESLSNNTNAWQIINLNAYREDLNKIKDETKELVNYLIAEKSLIKESYDAGDIDFDTYVDGINRVNEQIKQTQNQLNETDTKIANSMSDFLSSVNVYVEKALQAYSDISNAVFEKMQADMDAQMDVLEKENERLSDLLDEQVEMVEKHSSKIDEIEGELGDARGDRREQLVAALNAENIARERAYAEEKKIEKQKEKNEKAQEALEKKMNREKHKQQLAQAIVSAALATANGYATQPFMPVGLAMGSLAAALGAVQVALIASTKYAEGGLLTGPSHAQGGIKVPSLGAEVEGGEYVTNKRTTSLNLDLLQFVNSQKKRIDIADLVDFYNSGKKTSANLSKQKFADGGQLPIMSGLGFNSNANRIVVDTSDQPIYVSVEEIEKVQQNVRNVRVLAGAE